MGKNNFQVCLFWCKLYFHFAYFFCYFSVDIFCDVIAGNLDLTLNGGNGQKGQSGGKGSKGRDNGNGVRKNFVIYSSVNSFN